MPIRRGAAGRGDASAGRRRTEEGDGVLVARTRLGLTQPAFAQRLSDALGRSVDRTQVAKWEAGVYRPRTAVMLAAAALVGLPLHELLAEGRRMRGPVAPAGAAERATPSAELSDPRAQLRALLDLGFPLAEAIAIVRDHGGGPDR